MSITVTQLSELTEEINRAHRVITSVSGSTLEHAIRCGELLLQVKERVKEGQWTIWLEENLEFHKTTAFGYIRLAKNKDKLKGLTGIDPALALLSNGRTLTDVEKDEMYKLYANGEGKTLEEIAEIFHVRRSTVWYWVSAKNRDRIKRMQRHQRTRATRERQQAIKAAIISKHGGEMAKAYSEIRKAQQRIDIESARKGITAERRVKLLEALDALYQAEDKLGEAQRLL